MKYSLLKIISIIIISLVIIISGCKKKNRPPHTPYTPSGPSFGSIDKKHSFSSLAIDPDEDSITMRFDWGNGDTSAWVSDWDIWVASEQTIILSHSWSALDTYYIRAQAQDKNENISEWSMPHRLVITPNHPPDVPSISGPWTGYIQTTYQFSSSSIDPDGDSVAIRFDWGDGDSLNWSEWVLSGDSIWLSHGWLYPDTYQLRAQAKDDFGATSEWSLPFSVEIRNIISGFGWICATKHAGWTPRESHATVVFDNKMWVIGGAQWLPGEIECNDIWNSTDGINWTCVTDSAVFKAGDDTRAVVYDDKIWIIGGIEQGGFRNDVWCSSDGVNWTCVTDSAQWLPRCEHRVVVFDNKIWVLGGVGPSVAFGFKDVWFSSNGLNWICATDSAECLLEKDWYFSAAAFNNKLWVTGGDSKHNTWRPSFNDVWCSTDGRDWVQVTPHAPWRIRDEHEMLVFDNKMWILGGAGWDSIGRQGWLVVLDDVWYSTNGYFWACETSLTKFPKRYDFTSVVFDNKIWVMGGFDSTISLLNDVWYRDVIYKK